LSSRWLGDEGFFQPTGSAGMLGEQQGRGNKPRPSISRVSNSGSCSRYGFVSQ